MNELLVNIVLILLPNNPDTIFARKLKAFESTMALNETNIDETSTIIQKAPPGPFGISKEIMKL